MESALLGTYTRPAIQLVRGQGPWVYDSEGKCYLDFGSGIAVSALGHGHGGLLKAMQEQSLKLWHTSNLYHTEPAEKLAKLLVELSFAHKVFLCNSGTEANEAALKFACLFHKTNNQTRTRTVAFDRAFHGRTCGALSATSNPKYRDPFSAVRGLDALFAPFNETDGLENVITTETICVFLEPVQGEGGIHVATDAFMQRVRELCDATNTPLIFDEIQCGLGRTGTLFAYEQFKDSQNEMIIPDIVTLAKPLAGGLPSGAALVNEKIAKAVHPGDHGSTFGGNPLVCHVATELLKQVSSSHMLTHIKNMSHKLSGALEDLALIYPQHIKNLRGRGLMSGIDLSFEAGPFVDAAREQGLLLLTAGPQTIRLLPPFIIETAQIETFQKIFGELLRKQIL